MYCLDSITTKWQSEEVDIVQKITKYHSRYYNIDGRYDLKQFIRESEPTVRVQYAFAVFTPALIGLIIFTVIELQNGFVHSIFRLASIVQLLLAIGQLILEFYEVFVRGN
ncbi:hypothetical protein COOONC_25996 [Cooperia oncophora]